MAVNLISIFLILNLCVLCLGSASNSKPGYSYYPQLNGFLKVQTVPAEWLVARTKCHSEGELLEGLAGADLAFCLGALLTSPWTAAFTSAVNELQSADKQSLQVLFSGTQVIFPEGVYRDYIERLPGILLHLERCGVFYANGTVGDVSCSDRLPYVCFAQATTFGSEPVGSTTAQKLTPAPACEGSGYEFSNQTGSCYKFHSRVARWPEANKTCHEEHGKLVVVNSDIEAGVLVDIFKRQPFESIQGDIDDSDKVTYFAVGNYYDAGEWKTVDGQTLKQAGYENWLPNEPRVSESHRYGFMNRHGRLNNFSYPSNMYTYICEKTPQNV